MKINILIVLLISILIGMSAGCRTYYQVLDEPYLSVVNNVDENKVESWMTFCENKSGWQWEYQKVQVRGINRDTQAWSPHFQRNVGTLASGNVGECRATKDTASIVFAIHKDGFFPDEYGIHEMAHALAANKTGSVFLPDAWKSWVLGWHSGYGGIKGITNCPICGVP